MNNYLSLLPGSRVSKKMIPKELNEILLHGVPTRVQSKPICRAGILTKVPTRIHVNCVNTWKLWSKSTKVVTLLKISTVQILTVPVMAGNKRG